MYYKENLTQKDIAQKIGVSRPMVSRYLTRAVEEGLVEIIIHDELVHPYKNLERAVVNLYKIHDVVCVSNVNNDSSLKAFGVSAANYILKIIKDGQRIGVSSGTTLNAVSQAISSKKKFPNTTFIPLVGGMGNEKLDFHANHIVVQFAISLDSQYMLLHAPVMVDSKEAKAIFMAQHSINKVMEMAYDCDVAIVGIGGSPKHSTMVKSYMGENYEKLTDNSDDVGDICYNFIDSRGLASKNPWNERVISLSVEGLKRIPLVIGVAFGEQKVEAIKAILHSHLINVLISDEKTCRLLLSKT
ncbi:sugar-binding transcriptional regulator [Sporolactobacillus sp. KGMB 08714]|uniref:sugar-binding transcriptional regulator n=1 Tax=Sporolactobacillus sp. KGMB 08714 TaxID=3064704 RepID=UPI002FBD91A1